MVVLYRLKSSASAYSLAQNLRDLRFTVGNFSELTCRGVDLVAARADRDDFLAT